MRALIAAKHKRSWPAGSQFQPTVKLEMREGDGVWWHFLSVPADQVRDEIARWRAGNPDHEFRELPSVS